MEDCGDCICISFIPNEQIGRSSKSKPHIATLNELKLSFVKWIKENDPSLLACKVEAYLHDLGHEILWTPPYAPKLQPIELFWVAGKNHVTLQHNYDMTMREVVKCLREGWYGNRNAYPMDHPLFKRSVDCCALWRTCLDFARTIYVPICDGISGEIGSLDIDELHTDEMYNFPIDTLVLNSTKKILG